MIYVDIDGVCRDLAGTVFKEEPATWDQKNEDGLTAVDVINQNLTHLISAKSMEYLVVANAFFDKIHFLSAQPERWRPYTDAWLSVRVVPEYETIYVDHAIDKLDYLEEGDLLIDDSPVFGDYRNIALVDRAYNRQIDAPLRIKSAFEFIKVVKNHGNV